MPYPELVKFDDLVKRNPAYDVLSPVWMKIRDLVSGGWRMESKKRQYLEQRPLEDSTLYEHRLKKFVYTPILGDALSKYTTKLMSAPIHVEGAEGDTWKSFFSATDGSHRKEQELLSEMFFSLVQYGVLWVRTGRTGDINTTGMSRLEEERLGSVPRVDVLSPLDVVDWSTEGTNVDFIKTLDVKTISSSPFTPKRNIATWVVIDSQVVATYKAYVTLDEDGYVTGLDSAAAEDGEILDPRLVGSFENGTAKVALFEEKQHGGDGIPIVFYQLSPELWTCNQAYLKSLQHLQIENTWTDSATLAGMIQRIFTPAKDDVTPDDDPAFSYADGGDSLNKKEAIDLKVGNPYVLIGDRFEFVEADGSSLKTIAESVLDRIEAQIKGLIYAASSNNVGGSTNRGQDHQSGVAKAIDMSELDMKMKRYGAILVQVYQETLRKVAPILGTTPDNVLVSGLSSFDLDVLGNLLEDTTTIATIEDKLSPTALRLWYSRISEAMHPTATPQDLETIRNEKMQPPTK